MENNPPKYKTLSEWRKAEPKAYAAAKAKNLLIEICNSFGWKLPKEKDKYDVVKILGLAEKCKTFESFTKKHKKAYQCACELNIVEIIKQRIDAKRRILERKSSRYTKDYVFELASNSSSYDSFCKDKLASDIARRNNWTEEILKIIDKKQWDDLKDCRAFSAFTQTKEFLDRFDEFKKTYVDIPYFERVRYND